MQKKLKHLSIILLLALLVSNVIAQSDTFTGEIKNDDDTEEYEIELDEGDGVIITAIATDGSELDTVLTLLNSDGDEVGFNDDFEYPNSTNSRIAYIAEEDDEYTIVVSNYPGFDGEFELTVDYVSAEEAEEFIEVDINELIGDPDLEFDGFMSDDVADDEYEIDLEAGQGVVIIAEASGGSDLDTYIALFNEDGDEVAANDDAVPGQTLDSQIVYIAEDDGEYTIVMSNYPESEGDYDLTVTFITEEQADGLDDSVSVEDIVGEPDLEFDGFMSDDVADDEYEIDLEAGQGVIIFAEASSDSELDTYLALLDEDGEEVAANDDAVPGEVFDSRIVFVAEEAGEYTVVMSNYPGSEGDYDLTITFITAEEAEEVTLALEIVPEIDTTPERDPDEEHTGELDEGDEEEYTVELDAGDGLIAALYETDGAMDTLIYVVDPNGIEIVRNDDRGDYSTYDSQVGFIAGETGDYTVVVSHYPDAPGDYRLEIYYATPEEAALAEQAMRVLLSGPVQTLGTEHFLIHYTQEGVDAAEDDYVELVAEIVEEVYELQINELGWVAPPSDLVQGGDGRYDVYLSNLDDIYGYASSTSAEGDNPITDIEEEFAQAGFLVLDNDYADYPDSERALLATTAHEFHHVIQFGYDSGDANWYYEATSSWMETVTYPDDELATIYVEDVYPYPEVCFGETNGIYGTWLFFEFMSRELGNDAPLLLWDNIVLGDNWEPLEATLEEYDETIPSFIARYHINNLVRDYEFVDSFGGSTVWLENTIDDEDDWEPNGDGVQELGASYFYLDLSGDVYEVSIDDDDLEIYVIGIDGDDGSVHSLGDGGVVDTDDYDDTYIVVFNPDYDDDVTDCDYADYELTVEESSDDAQDALFKVDASEFRDLD